jgi:hypothetical protein
MWGLRRGAPRSLARPPRGARSCRGESGKGPAPRNHAFGSAIPSASCIGDFRPAHVSSQFSWNRLMSIAMVTVSTFHMLSTKLRSPLANSGWVYERTFTPRRAA